MKMLPKATDGRRGRGGADQ